ncbi:MAG: carboxypeptidase-like regulatory domain-containing protein, partial [Nitrososphaerales archaeon]
MRNFPAKLAMLAILLSTPFALLAQNQSSITGLVTDVTGAVLPGTTVTLTNPSKGLSYTQTTNSHGSYRFVNVPPAEGYIATFRHSGFADVVVRNLALEVGVT